MAISTDQRYLLNHWGLVPNKVQLGELIKDAEAVPSGSTYTHRVLYAGRYTSAGGSASFTISVPGVLATDNVQMHIHTKGATPRTFVQFKAAADGITAEMSGDPTTDHILEYAVLRAIS